MSFVEKVFSSGPEKASGERRIIAAVSDEVIDRDGDIVTAEAMRAAMPGFMRNPVILAAHTHRLADGRSPVVGHVVKWWAEGSKTVCEIEFADTDLGRDYFALYSGKIQRAFSIGFRPLKQERRVIDGKSVNVITEIELFEISAVAVPSNPEALSKSHSAKKDFVESKKRERYAEALRSRDPLAPYTKAQQALMDDDEKRELIDMGFETRALLWTMEYDQDWFEKEISSPEFKELEAMIADIAASGVEAKCFDPAAIEDELSGDSGPVENYAKFI